jgi:hypothetical protein
VPWDGVGLTKQISTDERMAQQYQKAKDGQNCLKKGKTSNDVSGNRKEKKCLRFTPFY